MKLLFGRLFAFGHPEFLNGLARHFIGVDALQQFAAERGEGFAARGLGNAGFLIGIDLLFESGEARSQRAREIGIGCTRRNEVENLIERDGGLAVERLGRRLFFLADANRIDDHEMRFVLGVGRDAL